MTPAQRYIDQGIERGIKQGKSASLLVLVRQRFGDAVNPQVEDRIVKASITQIEAWTARILSAATLSELLTD